MERQRIAATKKSVVQVFNFPAARGVINAQKQFYYDNCLNLNGYKELILILSFETFYFGVIQDFGNFICLVN